MQLTSEFKRRGCARDTAGSGLVGLRHVQCRSRQGPHLTVIMHFPSPHHSESRLLGHIVHWSLSHMILSASKYALSAEIVMWIFQPPESTYIVTTVISARPASGVTVTAANGQLAICLWAHQSIDCLAIYHPHSKSEG